MRALRQVPQQLCQAGKEGGRAGGQRCLYLRPEWVGELTGRCSAFEVVLNRLPGKKERGSGQGAKAPWVLGHDLLFWIFFPLFEAGSPTAEAGLQLLVLRHLFP